MIQNCIIVFSFAFLLALIFFLSLFSTLLSGQIYLGDLGNVL